MSASVPAYAIFILFTIAVVAIYAIVVVYSHERKRRSRALRSLYVADNQGGKGADDDASGFVRLCRDVLTLFGIDTAKKRKENYGQFGRAGFYTEDAVSIFLFYRYVIQPVILFIGAVVLAIGLTSPGGVLAAGNLIQVIIGFMLALFGISGHNMVLDKLGNRRRNKLIEEFPDSVDLLLICVESGMGLDAALSRVSHELQHTHVNVTSELERTRAELGLFGDRVQALQNFAERTDIQSYRSLVSALVQTEKYGTNLAATLRTLSKEYRTQRLLKAEEKAARVGALLTLPVVVGVFFPVMALIMSPPFIELFASGGLMAK